MTTELENTVLMALFNNGSKTWRVIFHKNRLIWCNEHPPTDQKIVPIENILAVDHEKLASSHPTENPRLDPHRFTIHYAEQDKDKWVYSKLTLKNGDPLQVLSWVKTLQNCLKTLKHRPGHLLLFVNPVGGSRNAMRIYEKYGGHLFGVSGVEVTLNVSQRKYQIRDYVLNHGLNTFDAVAVVGGDGTVSELFNGLVLRQCKETGIDANDINQQLPRPTLPVGIIPGGSTDTIVYCLHGTNDPTTAVLNIIFGDRLGLDLVSVYDERQLLRLYASALSYGFLGDVIYHSDRYRWMGPSRYGYSGFRSLLRNKGYKGEVAYYNNEADNMVLAKCEAKCDRCLERTSYIKNVNALKQPTALTGKNADWRTLSGTFFMVSGANISCATARTPSGLAPFGHVGDGCLQLIIIRHTSLFNVIRLLFTLTSKHPSLTDLPFVETYCAKEFCYRAIGEISCWNCDGEVQKPTNIRAKVCTQLLSIFSRRMTTDPNTNTPGSLSSSSCCSLG